MEQVTKVEWKRSGRWSWRAGFTTDIARIAVVESRDEGIFEFSVTSYEPMPEFVKNCAGLYTVERSGVCFDLESAKQAAEKMLFDTFTCDPQVWSNASR